LGNDRKERGRVLGRGLGSLPALPRFEGERVSDIGRLSGGFVNEMARLQSIRAFAARAAGIKRYALRALRP